MHKTIRREILLLLQFGVISLIATTVAFVIFDKAQTRMYLGADLGDPTNAAPNIKEMEMFIWNSYFRWFFLLFLCLALVRIAILWLVGSVKFKPDILD